MVVYEEKNFSRSWTINSDFKKINSNAIIIKLIYRPVRSVCSSYMVFFPCLLSVVPLICMLFIAFVTGGASPFQMHCITTNALHHAGTSIVSDKCDNIKNSDILT